MGDLVNNVLYDGFSTNALVDAAQDYSLPALPREVIMDFIHSSTFDVRAPITQQLIELLKQNNSEFHLPNKIINFSYFVDILIEEIENQLQLDERLKDTAPLLKKAILKLLIDDDRFLKSSKHYFRESLDTLFKYSTGWTQLLGNLGDEFLDLWCEAIDSTIHLNTQDMVLDSCIKCALESIIAFHKQTQSTERETISEIKQKIKRNEHVRQVNELLDQQLEGKIFPQGIAEFLNNEWRKTLILGKKYKHPRHATWNQLHQFTLSLVEHFSIENDRSKVASVATIRPNLIKLLVGEEVDIQQTLHLIDEVNRKILNNIPLEGTKAKALLEENRLKHLKTNSNLLKVVTNLKVGQWLKSENADWGVDRIKVAKKIDTTREILFVDFLGNFVKTRSYLGTAYDLISQKLIRMESDQTFNRCFVNALEIYFVDYKKKCKLDDENLKKRQEEERRINALKKAKREAEDLREQNEKMETMLIQETHKLRIKNIEMQNSLKQQLTEKTFLESEKTQLKKVQEKIKTKQAELLDNYSSELHSLKEEKQRIEQNHKNEISSLLSEKLALEKALAEQSKAHYQQQVLQAVSALTVGSWLNIPDKNNHTQACRIAVIYSSGKYVFVNQAGIRINELTSDEIVSLIVNGKAEILRTENTFDRSMEDIIHSLKN